MSGDAELTRMIRKIKKIPELAREAAPAAAQSFHAAVASELAAGVSPGGGPWANRKDGGRALANAASNAVATKAVGTTIITVVQGHYFFHNAGRGVPQRRVVPDRLTPKLAAAIRRPLVDAFDKRVRRG